MAIEVYWGSGSGPAWRVLLGFLIKGVPFDSKRIQFDKREHKTPAFLAMNPRGKVPTVREGDFALDESLAILAWLDKRHPEVPILGASPAEAGQIWRAILAHEYYADPAFRAVSRPILFPAGFDAGKVRDALPAMREQLDWLEAQVSQGGAVVGSELTAADAVWFPAVSTLVRAATRPVAKDLDLNVFPLQNRWPAVAAWASRIEALPGFDAVYPPHWREGAVPSPGRIGA